LAQRLCASIQTQEICDRPAKGLVQRASAADIHHQIAYPARRLVRAGRITFIDADGIREASHETLKIARVQRSPGSLQKGCGDYRNVSTPRTHYDLSCS
jgi:hypothetical protein